MDELTNLLRALQAARLCLVQGGDMGPGMATGCSLEGGSPAHLWLWYWTAASHGRQHLYFSLRTLGQVSCSSVTSDDSCWYGKPAAVGMEFERSAEQGKGWCCSLGQVALQLPAGARWGRFRILSSGRKLQKAKHLAKALTESGGENGTCRV